MKTIELQPTLIGSLMPIQSTEYDTKELNKSLESMSIPAMKITYDNTEGYMYEESGYVPSSVQAQYVDTMMYYLDEAMSKSEAAATNEKKTIATFSNQLNYVAAKLEAKLEEAKALAVLARTYATTDQMTDDILLLTKRVETAISEGNKDNN
jgi:predicted amidohydrolase YtcJ